MTAIQFYHLTTTPLERALPKLLEKAYAAKLPTHVLLSTDEQVEFINQLLWTYDPDSFLPHGGPKDADPERQPIYLSASPEAPNNPAALFVTQGEVAEAGRYTRVLDLFDGRSEEAVAAARSRWKTYKDAGHDISYFKQKPDGGWEKAA